MKTCSHLKHITAYLLCTAIFLGGLNCAGIGLVSEKYPEAFYTVPRVQPIISTESDVTFLVYSDNQAGWRVKEVFYKGWSLNNWRLLLFPFYELYVIGNGLVGAVNWLRHSPDYGAAERLMVRDAIYDEATRVPADFILNVGDISAHDGRRPAHWALFLRENKIEHPLLNEIPYLPVIGNHEKANDTTYAFPNFQSVFDYPRFYTVECGSALLIVLDSNLIIDQYQYIDDEVQEALFQEWFVAEDPENDPSWLERQLSSTEKPLKIVAMHNPPISFGRHHTDWLEPGSGRDLLQKRRRLIQLFDRYNVQVVFSGHDHLYQHSIVRYDQNRETHFIVGGGGGTPLRDVPDEGTRAAYLRHFQNEGFDVSLQTVAKIYHYCLVRVNADRCSIHVVQVTGEKDQPTRSVEQIEIKIAMENEG